MTRYSALVFGAMQMLVCATAVGQGTLTSSGQAASTSSGQAWPAKSERVTVPMATGGGGGLIGIGMVVKSPPDGYTLMLISGSVPAAIAAHKPSYNAFGGLSGVVRVGYSPLMMVVHPAVPVRTLRELIALMCARPADVVCAAGGGQPYASGDGIFDNAHAYVARAVQKHRTGYA